MRRERITTGQYALLYEIRPGSGVYRRVARAVKTGTRRDNYPWEWYFDYGVSLKEKGAREQGTASSLYECCDYVESRIKTFGVEMETVETDGNQS